MSTNMTRKLTAVLTAVLLWAVPAWDQIALPEKASGDVGEFVTVKAETKAAVVGWYVPDKGLALFPVDLLKDTKTAVVVAKAPGTYRLVAYAEVDKKPVHAVVVVVVGGVPVPPDPGPNPPVPPPDDPFAKALQAAWDTSKLVEAKADESRRLLAHLYREAAQTTVNDPALKTVGQLLGKLQNATDGMPELKGALTPARKVVADYLRKELPPLTTDLNPDVRAACGRVFARVGAALEGLR